MKKFFTFFAAILCTANLWAATVNLSTISSNYTAPDGTTLTGTLGANVKISIAADATVTLNNVTINGVNNSSYNWAGITCLGNATLVITGTNTITGFYESAGISVPSTYTLTIQGTGSLTANGGEGSAGIGSGNRGYGGNITINSGTITANGGIYGAGIGTGDDNATCGNITINGGAITATGGRRGAGIGAGDEGRCGNIVISGATVTATGGDHAAGIGSGFSDDSRCGSITIGRSTVTATRGNSDSYPIGRGYKGSCGAIIITPYTTDDNGSSTRRITWVAATLTSAPTAKTGLAYTGSAQALVNAGTATNGTVNYSLDNSTWSASIPTATETGIYTVYYKVVGDANHGDYTPASNTVAVTVDFGGSGTEVNPYLIPSASAWDFLADQVNNGTNEYSGKFFRQTANISVTTMIGRDADGKRFGATYDGDGHTLSIALTLLNSDETVAPFRYIKGATIKNLHTTGTIDTNRKYAGGIVGRAVGNNTVINCSSDVYISSTLSGDATHGGIIGLVWSYNYQSTTTTIEGCVFNGKLLGTSSSNCGGFVGWCSDDQNVRLVLRNNLYIPQQRNIGTSSSKTFARANNPSLLTITNCYYSETFGDAQGKEMHSITAGEGTTVTNAGSPTVYNVSGITSYGTGIKYNDVLYGGQSDAVSLNLSHDEGEEGYWFNGYSATSGTLTGSANPYSLTMANANTVVSAQWLTPSEGPLTFEAMEDGAAVQYYISTGTIPSIEYSTNGTDWATSTEPFTITLEHAGDKLYLRGNHTTYKGSSYASARIQCSKDCYIYGNIMSLVNATNYTNATSVSSLRSLFYENIHIKNHPTHDLLLPATSLGNECYSSLFQGCTGLTRIPALPATNLQSSCYDQMFCGCTGLTSIPANLLPATTMKSSCYSGMFSGCTGLTSIPANLLQSVTTLETYCYSYMFNGCTGLESIPENLLPITTLKSNCYKAMFKGCTGLTSIPANLLPATSLVEQCYNEMFYGCTGLTSIPENLLHATTLANYCYWYMFYHCTGLTSIPANLLPATTLAQSCYENMFADCFGLTTLPANLLHATTLAPNCYCSMFNRCTGLTTLPANLLPATTLVNSCYSNMFTSCSGLTSIPENLLPNTTLVSSCYSSMFSYCTGLTSLPENLLPATTLASGCYSGMFSSCSGLTTLPANLLPATTLAQSCYSGMFSNCTGLTTLPANLLPATTLEAECYQSMFNGCSNLTASPVLPAENIANNAYYWMFYNCSNLSEVTCYAKAKSGSYSTWWWLYGVASSGTFYAPIDNLFADLARGDDAIPSGWTVKNIVPANQDPQNEGIYYSTLYHNSQRYVLPEGTEAFIAKISGDALILTKIAEGGQVIPADNAVILKSDAQTIHLEQTDADPVTVDPERNSLQGSNSTVTNNGSMYVLSGADGVVGFYKLASGTDVPAYKAYITLSGMAGAPKKLRFVYDSTTDIETITNDQSPITRKVLRNGQVIIIRNGMEFNVNGQKLK